MITWRACGQGPSVKNATAVCIREEQLVVIGGFSGLDNTIEVHLQTQRGGEWHGVQTSGEEVPSPRNGHCAVYVGESRILVMGGWLGDRVCTDVFCLDTRTWVWEKWPVSLVCNLSVAIFSNGVVYVFRGGDGQQYYNDVFAIDVEARCITEVCVSGTPPSPRANASGVLVRDDVFSMCGWDGRQKMNDVHRFHLPTHTWHRVPTNAPIITAGATASHYSMSLGVKDYIVLCGESGDAEDETQWGKIHMLDVGTLGWRSFRPIAEEAAAGGEAVAFTNRSGHCACNIASYPRIVLIGGRSVRAGDICLSVSLWISVW